MICYCTKSLLMMICLFGVYYRLSSLFLLFLVSFLILYKPTGSHNIGIAMATSHGLAVPNIKNVQSLSILEVNVNLIDLNSLFFFCSCLNFYILK